MTTVLESPTTSSALVTAQRNFRANREAMLMSLGVSNSITAFPDDMEWLFARDGSLSARDASGKWWAGCSLPMRAAKFMLKKAELDGTVVGFLYPTHAAQLRVALDCANANQAILALTPDEKTLAMLLACADFSADIARQRLYFAAGSEWEKRLDRLLENLPGLPTPTQFIRPILADASPADELIAPAQAIFAKHSQRRAERVSELRANWQRRSIRKICVVAPMDFRLWDDAGWTLGRAMDGMASEFSQRRFNPDDPAGSSSLALAEAASEYDAIVTPNLTRADLPDLLPLDMPWATWITRPRISPADKAGPRDMLLLADPQWKELALERGWRKEQIRVAGWPIALAMAPADMPGALRVPAEKQLAMICDTRPLSPDERITEYSSHRLLWEAIAQELLTDPFVVANEPEAYLADRMRRLNVEADGFDRPAFRDGVVLQARQQGLVRLLLREQIPVRLFGKGWNEIEEFSSFAAGPITAREQFAAALSEATALVHAWPLTHAHPIDATGKPVVRAGRRVEAFLHGAKLALAGQLPAGNASSTERLSAELITNALSQAAR